ncbi:MAG: non-heme iron oxygenase ferredoxin subunit [Aquisalimonadaceae bacterium]
MSSADSSAPNWRPLCAASDVDADIPVRVVIEGLPPLAVFQLDDGYYVTDDTCTHGEASLSDGFVEGDEVECPWHSGKFCIRDGRATAFPAVDPIRAYRTEVIDGQVCIDMRDAP